MKYTTERFYTIIITEIRLVFNYKIKEYKVIEEADYGYVSLRLNRKTDILVQY